MFCFIGLSHITREKRVLIIITSMERCMKCMAVACACLCYVYVDQTIKMRTVDYGVRYEEDRDHFFLQKGFKI